MNGREAERQKKQDESCARDRFLPARKAFDPQGQMFEFDAIHPVVMPSKGILALKLLPSSSMTVSSMTVEQAKSLIKNCADQMNARYKKVVFDEWAIVSLNDRKGQLLAYIGPRKEGFQQNFVNDAGSLRSGLLAQEYQVGDFEFARHGVGPAFEAFMALGKGIYLICNNTVQSMDGITQDPLWLNAQVPFVEMSEQFRAEPLAV